MTDKTAEFRSAMHTLTVTRSKTGLTDRIVAAETSTTITKNQAECKGKFKSFVSESVVEAENAKHHEEGTIVFYPPLSTAALCAVIPF